MVVDHETTWYFSYLTLTNIRRAKIRQKPYTKLLLDLLSNEIYVLGLTLKCSKNAKSYQFIPHAGLLQTVKMEMKFVKSNHHDQK